MDDEMMAIMGLSGFGKTTKKKVVGASAFERTKRVAEVSEELDNVKVSLGS